jgi:hypothetical protein
VANRPLKIGDPCPTCASGRIGQSGHNYRCANCGWLGPHIDSNATERGGPSSEGTARADVRGERATGETGDDRPAAPVSQTSNEQVDHRRLPALIRHLEECFAKLGHTEVFLNRNDWNAIKAALRTTGETAAEPAPHCPLPPSDRNTIIDAMSYAREYVMRWKGAGNSLNAQYTLERLQRMLERTQATPSGEAGGS